MKILVDEMYPAAIADGLRTAGVDAVTVVELRLGGASDAEVFAAAVADGYAVLTENVADFTRIASEHTLSGAHHSGLILALSSRFSRRPAGVPPLIASVRAIREQELDDRIVYLERVAG